MSHPKAKKRLLILSDLWGWNGATWLNSYQDILSQKYDCVCYDSRMIANVNELSVSEKVIHQRFVNGGIEHAVCQLLTLEQDTEVDVLAFSVGATITWKAMLRGLNVRLLYGLSGTRLRYEVDKPDGHINLFYGEDDPFRPNENWMENQEVMVTVLKKYNHDLYKNPIIIKEISLSLIGE